MSISKYIYSFILFLMPFSVSAQQVIAYGIEDILEIATGHSLIAAQNNKDLQIAILDYQSSQANFKPNLGLRGRVPAYLRSSQEIIQPDGTIKFQSVRNNNSSISLIGEQNVVSTGGTIRVISDIQRFDDFGSNFKSYNGVPIRLGYNQPLFNFNSFKWEKDLSGIRNQEAKRKYQSKTAENAVLLSELFFDLALAESNLQRAYQNLRNTDTLFTIAQERFQLGRISKHDLLQLNLEKVNAEQSLANLIGNLQTAQQKVDQFSGYKLADTFTIELPQTIPNVLITYEKALQEARANRPEPIQYLLTLKQAEQELDFQQKSAGLNANLDVSFGFARGAENIEDIYLNPQQEQAVSFTFAVPIADWGRSKYQIKKAQEELNFTQFENAQLEKDFDAQLKLLIDQFYRLKNAFTLAQQADELAKERYQIARDRYVFGDINILDLSFSQREKDSARQNYLASLANTWIAFYQIRAFTLYDFETNQKIEFNSDY